MLKRFGLLLVSLVLLAGCASIPLSTLWKLRGFDEQALMQLEPAELRVALSLQPAVGVRPDSVKLELALEREDGAPESYAFALEPAAGAGPLDRDRRYGLWQLDDAGRRALTAVQTRLRRAEAEGSKAYEGASFTVNFRPELPEPRPASLAVTVQLLLDPAEGWFVLLDDAELEIRQEPTL